MCIRDSQKTYQKPFQNEVRTHPKSMLKMRCFSTSIFWGLGLDFGASWASNLEPSWSFWPQNFSAVDFLKGFKIHVLLNHHLGGFLAQFWRLQGFILEPLRLDFTHFVNISERFLPSASSKTCFLKSTLPIKKWSPQA